MDGFADMTDEQLVQTCARLESRGQMQLTLLSNLEEERSALQAQRDLLERRIFEVQEEARTAAMARPERFQPNVPTLRAPERLQLKLHDAAIELTWFWQPWQPGQPAWPLRSVRFEVQQLSDGVGGRLRVRTFQCEASGQVEQRCLIDSWTRGKAYAFQARACAEVGDASEPKELWTSISSIFSEPVNLPAESPGLYSRDSLVTSSPPREVRAEAYASHTFHKSEQQTVSPPFNPAAATATAKAQEEACRREAAETALEKIKAELDEERRSYHELLAQPTAKAQEEASRREAAETALEKIKADLDQERRSYHELWVRHEEQGCEILALKEEVQEWRAELKEAKNMDSQHTGEFDEWKQQAQLEQEELRRRLQNSEETIRRAAEKESEQAKLLETNGRLRIELERWKSEEQQCREQLEKVKIEKEVADRTIQSLQESSQERVQELQRLERPPISSTPFSPAPMDGVSSADRWVTSRREPQPRQSEGHQMVSLQTAHLVPTNPHQRDPRGIAVGEMCGSAPDVLGPTVVQLPRHHLGAVPAVPAVHDMSRMERPAGPPVAPLPGTQLPVAHFSQPVGQLPHLPVGHLPGPCISPPLSCSHSFTPSDSAGYSDDLPPPPRSAPSRALESSNAAVTGRAGSGSFVLSLLASENRWELFHFGDGRGTLEQQALDFLKEKRLKAALAPGLASKMRSMINAGLTRSSVDIVDLI